MRTPSHGNRDKPEPSPAPAATAEAKAAEKLRLEMEREIEERTQTIIDRLMHLREEKQLKHFAEVHGFQYSWLTRFARGEIPEVGGSKIWRLEMLFTRMDEGSEFHRPGTEIKDDTP